MIRVTYVKKFIQIEHTHTHIYILKQLRFTKTYTILTYMDTGTSGKTFFFLLYLYFSEFTELLPQAFLHTVVSGLLYITDKIT